MVKKVSNTTSEIEVKAPKSPEEIAEWIAVAAYYKAKDRGFSTGNEVEDWIEAEREIATKLGFKTEEE